MAQKGIASSWALDQILKGAFFHQKLHEWGLLEILEQIVAIGHREAANWSWPQQALGISPRAWNKVIHQGIEPVKVFAHPRVLVSVAGAVGYYRMLALVSQKSMRNVGLPVESFELPQSRLPDEETALRLARHFNHLISRLVEEETHSLREEEFLLWRGMAAGAQAQGSWQNRKGAIAEEWVRQRLREHLVHLGWKKQPLPRGEAWTGEAKTVVFSSEPDVEVRQEGRLIGAVEIKGGIDKAGVLERLGAAVKSLRRAKDEDPAAMTILILTAASLTEQAKQDLHMQRQVVNRWYTLEQLLQDPQTWQKFLDELRLASP
ncbi:MAG TPA: XcyI family restriction endonuclease [Anaerolineales bacterium]|nr:XcyI family restriction endonuclease [Anaerolineales bacterium]